MEWAGQRVADHEAGCPQDGAICHGMVWLHFPSGGLQTDKTGEIINEDICCSCPGK